MCFYYFINICIECFFKKMQHGSYIIHHKYLDNCASKPEIVIDCVFIHIHWTFMFTISTKLYLIYLKFQDSCH